MLTAMAPRRVAVIGAGVSGLAAAKALLERGNVPVVFERGPALGGVWTFDEAAPDGGGPAYRSLHTNTGKAITAFSDFPFPGELPEHPARVDVERYLNAYAHHFDVYDRIQFHTEVKTVVPAEQGRWQVTVEGPAGPATDLFDGVVICSGVFSDPMMPSFPGMESFQGNILHSRAYTAPEPFVGRRVVVVGLGSSGADLAVEISGVAEQVWLVGHGRWSESVGPTTPLTPTRWQQSRQRLQRAKAILSRRMWLCLQAVRRRVYGHPDPDAPFALVEPPFVPKQRLRESLASGAIRPKPEITALAGDTVMFSDGSTVQADTIICATGYGVSFPFLDPAVHWGSRQGLDLYRLIVAPDWPTLAFIGMFRVTGPAPPVAEMQARWAAALLSDRIPVPSPTEMRAAIAARRTLIAQHHSNPLRLNAEAYQDTLAADLGVLPHLWRHFGLVSRLLFGPPIAAQYRLDGPNRWSAAPTIIKAGADRTAQLEVAEGAGSDTGGANLGQA